MRKASREQGYALPNKLVVAPRTSVTSTMRRVMLASLLLCAVTSDTNVSCQIFDETMVCDNEKGVMRGEIRTCSG